ncbi:MAG: DUF5063 domain-containing protein [Burkholderiales bacterium]|jgi:hypothetical protein|nr:DUF5063 domain-containing protein [Burkholderiales bacterium]
MPPPLQAAASFADLARGFCSWCEASEFNGSERSVASWLARLYAAALELPDVDPENSDCLPELPGAAAAAAAANLACFNGCYYRMIFDPDPVADDEAVIGDLGDDLLDVYKDLKAGLVLEDRGMRTDALWHWAFQHRIHWGRHAAAALFALHGLTISKLD